MTRHTTPGRLVTACMLAVSLLALGCSGRGGGQDAGQAWHYDEDDLWTPFHLQVRGTHNSYHVQGDIDFPGWNYTMLPLDEQAERQGIRAVELDVHEMTGQPDLAVFHLATVDPVSTCATFRECLAALKSWSDAHPAHHVLFLQVEPKSADGTADLEPFFARLEGDLLATWGRDRLLVPDEVQGDAASLAEAVRTRGWPTLGKLRGKMIVAMDNADTIRAQYTHGGQHLHGRLLFVNSAPTDAYAAVAVLNDPVAGAADIAAALGAGMLVRTRADEEGVEPRANDTTRLQAALASGAHVIITDYPEPVPDAGVPYVFDVPGGTPSRCNPVTTLDAGRPCTAHALEDPAFMR